MEELAWYQTPDPECRAGLCVAEKSGNWGHRREVERTVVFAFPKPVRLCLVGEPAAPAKGAFNQVCRMLASANPIPTSNRIEQHACSLGIG